MIFLLLSDSALISIDLKLVCCFINCYYLLFHTTWCLSTPELRDKLKKEQEELLAEQERVRQQRAALQQEEQAILSEARRKKLEIRQHLQHDSYVTGVMLKPYWI